MSDRPNAMLQDLLAMRQLAKLRNEQLSDDDRITALYRQRHADQESEFADRVHTAAADLDRSRTGQAEILNDLYHKVAGVLQRRMEKHRIGFDIINERIDYYRKVRGLPAIDPPDVQRARTARIEQALAGDLDWRERIDEALSAEHADPATDKSAHLQDTEADVAAAVEQLTPSETG